MRFFRWLKGQPDPPTPRWLFGLLFVGCFLSAATFVLRLFTGDVW